MNNREYKTARDAFLEFVYPAIGFLGMFVLFIVVSIAFDKL